MSRRPTAGPGLRRAGLDDDEGDDPLLSVINLIDVFLIIVAVLLLVLARRAPELRGGENVTVIRNAGRPDMEVTVRTAEKVEHYKADGSTGVGAGVKAGQLYRMPDGTMMLVPD